MGGGILGGAACRRIWRWAVSGGGVLGNILVVQEQKGCSVGGACALRESHRVSINIGDLARPRNLALWNSPEAPEGAKQTGLAATVGAYIAAKCDEIESTRTVMSVGSLPVTMRGNPLRTVKVSPLTYKRTHEFEVAHQTHRVAIAQMKGGRWSEGLPAAASAGWRHDVDATEVNVAVSALNKSWGWQKLIIMWQRFTAAMTRDTTSLFQSLFARELFQHKHCVRDVFQCAHERAQTFLKTSQHAHSGSGREISA